MKMSTKLYTFKVPKNSVFTFADSIRAHVLEQRKHLIEKGDFKTVDFIQEHKDEYEVELQFFDVNNGIKAYKDTYIVRVLEAGYLVHNWLWGLKHPTCNYDDRTDIPKRDQGNKRIAEIVDDLIEKRHYFVVPAVSVADYLQAIFRREYYDEMQQAKAVKEHADKEAATNDNL
jgi:hypothetical protein